MSKISILEIIGDSSLAGAPRHLLSILENLNLKKFTVTVICPPGPLAGKIRDIHRPIDLDVIPMRSRFDTEAVRKIRKTIKHYNPNIVHIHGTRAGLLGRLAVIGLNKRVIYTEHLWTEHYSLDSRILNFFHYFSNWFLDMFTTLNIAVSGAVKDYMVNKNITRPGKVVVIYNGVEEAKEKANVFENEKEIKIVTVGTLNRQKGMQYLIKALPKVIKEFPDVKLEIVGDGGYKKDLQSQVKHLKLKDHVKFVGFLPDVEKYLAKFDIYVQPSLSESFGLAIVQAMGAGLPVIATNTGGIPEIITDGITGLLVESKDSKAISEALIELLRDPKKAREMGKVAREEVKLKFNLQDMIDELEVTYEETAKIPAFSE